MVKVSKLDLYLLLKLLKINNFGYLRFPMIL